MDTIGSILKDDADWNVLLSFLPDSWQNLAKETGALLRSRKFTPENLLRSLLIHLADGCSLRETSTRTKQGDIAKVSDVALLKRLNASGEWFRKMSLGLRSRWVIQPAESLLCSEYRVRLIDGSIVSEPGAAGSTWRIHYSVQLAFKRLKSLLGLGHLRKMDPEGAKAWLHGKLFVAMLIEAMIACGETFPPGDTQRPRAKHSNRCHWRETSFMLHLVSRAQNAALGLAQSIMQWRAILTHLKEPPRKRITQYEKHRRPLLS